MCKSPVYDDSAPTWHCSLSIAPVLSLPMQAKSWLQSQVAGAQSSVLTLILFRKTSNADLEWRQCLSWVKDPEDEGALSVNLSSLMALSQWEGNNQHRLFLHVWGFLWWCLFNLTPMDRFFQLLSKMCCSNGLHSWAVWVSLRGCTLLPLTASCQGYIWFSALCWCYQALVGLCTGSDTSAASIAVWCGGKDPVNVACIELTVFLSHILSLLPILPPCHLCWVLARCHSLMQWLCWHVTDNPLFFYQLKPHC